MVRKIDGFGIRFMKTMVDSEEVGGGVYEGGEYMGGVYGKEYGG